MNDSSERDATAGLSDRYVKQLEVVWKEIIRAELKSLTDSFVAQMEVKLKEFLQTELEKKCLENFEKIVEKTTKKNAPMTWSKVVASNTSQINSGAKSNSAAKSLIEDEGSLLRNGKRRRLASKDAISKENGKNDEPTSNNSLNIESRNKTAIDRLDETVCFKPKKSQPMDVSRNELRSSIDPIQSGVKSVRYIEATEEIYVRCHNKESALKLLNAAQKNLGNKYNINIKKPYKPKLRIVGFEAEENDESGCLFVEKLIKQNGLSEGADIKIVKTYKNEKWKNSSSIAIVEVDAGTFESLISKGKVNIGWDRCKVFEAISVLRCFKCWNFGHKFADCKESFCCPRCAEGHEIKDCMADFEKCANCEKYNLKMNLSPDKKFDVCHPAYSHECQMYKNKQNKAKRFINYNK